MVNTGKPSSGCKLCRARRIKCDEAKPACMKCLRSKRQCPGYRDPFEGKIRDETQSTIRKFKRTRIVIEKAQVLQEEALRANKKTSKKNDDDYDGGHDHDDEDEQEEDDDLNNKTSSDVESNGSSGWSWGRGGRYEDGWDGDWGKTPPPSASSTSSFDSNINGDFLTSLVTPLEQQAACYLLADYVLVSDSPGSRKGYYKFAYKIMTRPQPSKCLLSAFKAVSFVALASRPGASYLTIEAEFHYSKALREVNKAIQNPEEVKKDDTLGAVLLLAFYETLATTRERLDEYVSHIKGAAQLVKMRGPSLVDTDEGLEMFSMTRNQFLAVRHLSPALDHEDYSWLLKQNCKDAHVSRVATLTIACSEIRMQVDRALSGARRRDPRRIQAVLDLLRKAQALSKKLLTLDQASGTVWRVVKQAAGASPPPAGGWSEQQQAQAVALADRYEFHNLYACMIYCIVWTSHLYLTTCMFRCMAWLVAPDAWQSGAEYEAAAAVTRRRVADICAALPYACSWNGHATGYSDFVCGATSPSSPAKGVAGMCIYRPAFTAMMSDYASPAQKAYLDERLRFLADKVGIKQAGVLLKVSLCVKASSGVVGLLKWLKN